MLWMFLAEPSPSSLHFLEGGEGRVKHPKDSLYFSLWMRRMGLLITEDGGKARSSWSCGQSSHKSDSLFLLEQCCLCGVLFLLPAQSW